MKSSRALTSAMIYFVAMDSDSTCCAVQWTTCEGNFRKSVKPVSMNLLGWAAYM